MRQYLTVIVFVSTLAVTLIGCSGGGGADSPTPTPVATATPAPITTPAPTPTPSGLATPIPTRTYKLAVRGSRGSIPLTVLGTTNTVVPGSTINASTLLSVANLLSTPTIYGDRRFAGWEYNGTRFSTAAAINDLPGAVNDGETITAVYEPAGTGTKPFTPNYNDSEPAFWSSPGNLKIFFEASVTAEFQTICREGFDRWIEALGSNFGYTVVTSKTGANIVVSMGTVASASAYTTLEYSSGASPTPIDSVTMTFDSSKLPSFSIPGNRSAVVALASHEFGHALGIGQHSTVSIDTMFATVTDKTTGITQRDINTIMNMYSIFDGRHRPVTRATGIRTKIIDCNVHIAP